MKFSILAKFDTALILLLITVLGSSQVTGFQCYKCTNNENPDCVENPDEINSGLATVECPSEGYCTIVRTEYTDIPGKVVTLVRDCSEKEPLISNDVRTDKHYTKMYTSCNTDKCNSGDGQREPGSSGGSFGPTNLIIVPESSNSIVTKPLHVLLLGLMAILMMLAK